MYHHLEKGCKTNEPYTITLGQFERQLRFLQHKGFTTITFADLFRVLDGTDPAPPKPVIVTFDDGYSSFLELALPAIVSHKMKATIFIVAGEVGGYNRWDMEHGVARRQLLSEEGIRAVLEAGMEVGSHGWAHRNMRDCTEPEFREEIFRSKLELAIRFGFNPEVFSYPFGAFSPIHYPLLEEAGYRGAVSILSDQPAVTSNRFAMRRVYIHADDGAIRFRWKLSCAYLRYTGRRAAH